MRYDYKGFWDCHPSCDIEVHRRSDGKYYAEHLATAMRVQYGLKPEDVIWIEHYPEAKDRRKENFDLVRFAIEGGAFRASVWTRITEQAVDDLIAGVRNVEDLFPRRVKEHPLRQTGLGR